MTIYSVFGSSLVASTLAGSLIFQASLPVPASAPLTMPGPEAASRTDHSANMVFDRDGRVIGRSILVVSTDSGQLVAVMERSAAETNVIMKRGADGALRLEAE